MDGFNVVLRRIAFLFVFFSVCLASGLNRDYAGVKDREEGRRAGGLRPDAVYTYRVVDGFELQGDFFMAKTGEGPHPAVVLIHGGGWKDGDKSDMAHYAQHLTKRGYACFSINYRLTPDGRFPNNINDCKAAVQWLRKYASGFNVDPDRIAAWGGSAGGHLSAFIGATDDDDGFNIEGLDVSGRVQAVVPFYGVFDFAALSDNLRALAEYTYISPVGTTIDEHLRRISPATYVTPDDPPVFLVHGIEDSLVPVEQSEIYYDLLQETGIHCGLLLVEGAGHALKEVKGMTMSPSRDEAIEAAIDFLDEVL